MTYGGIKLLEDWSHNNNNNNNNNNVGRTKHVDKRSIRQTFPTRNDERFERFEVG